MAVNPDKTSFRQYEYCSFCRLNHKKGKKHLYSTKHRTIVHNILDKAQKKISDATETLSDPQIEPLGKADMKHNFWCYFCALEIARHEMLDVCVLKHGSMLEHIASEEHIKKAADFFRAHRIDESVRGRDLHCLTPDRLRAYKLLTIKAVQRYEERQKHQNRMIAKKLKEQEAVRESIIQSEESRKHVIQENDDEEQKGEGDVHVGLQPRSHDITDGDSNQEIGPTLDVYQRYVEYEKKKKLSGWRSGSSSAKSDRWLHPSIGQVWPAGHHHNSKKETKRLTLLGKRANSEFQQETSSGLPTASQRGEAPQLDTNLAMPYQSKRQHKMLDCGPGEIDQSQRVLNIPTNHGHAGYLSSIECSKPMENSHNDSNKISDRKSDNHRFKGFIPSVNQCSSKQDYTDKDRGIPQTGQSRGFSQTGHGRGIPQTGQGHFDRVLNGQNQMIQGPHSEQKLNVPFQHEQHLTSQLPDLGYKRKKGNNSEFPTTLTINKCENPPRTEDSSTSRTCLISTPLLDKK